MAGKKPNDFRHVAAQQSLRLLKSSRVHNPLNSESSLCVPNEGDAAGSLYRIAVIPWLLLGPGLLLALFGIVYGLLLLTPWVDLSIISIGITAGALVVGVVVALMSNGIGDGLFDRAVGRWNGSAFLRDLEGRIDQCYRVAVEDPVTYQRQKVISEDYAKGGVDRSGRGLLLAGCQYQYVIRPGDVTEVREEKTHILITVRIGTDLMTLALAPLTSDDEEENRFRSQLLTALRPAVTSRSL